MGGHGRVGDEDLLRPSIDQDVLSSVATLESDPMTPYTLRPTLAISSGLKAAASPTLVRDFPRRPAGGRGDIT
jgi:hypothetical protein